MKKLLSIISALGLSVAALGQQATNVQKGGAAGTNNLTADLNVGTGRTLTISAGGTFLDSNLTNGRVTLAGAGGLLTDDSDLTFSGDTLTATKFAGALNGTVGATTPMTGAFTTGVFSTSVSTPSIITASGTFTSTLNVTGTGSPVIGPTSGGTYNGNIQFGYSDQYPEVRFRNAVTTKANFFVDANLGDFYVDVSSGRSVNFRDGIGGGGGMILSGTLAQTWVHATTVSTSTTSGALRVDGGLGVGGAAYFGGSTNISYSPAAAPGILTGHTLVLLGTSDASGTGSVRGINETYRVTGTSSVSELTGRIGVIDNNLSVGTVAAQYGSRVSVRLLAAGATSTAYGYTSASLINSTGHGGNWIGYAVESPIYASTGRWNGTTTGVDVQNLGHADTPIVTGVNVANQTKGSGNAYAYRGQMASGSGKYNLYMDGTAENYLAGTLQVDGGILGTATNNSATAGNVGEELKTTVASGSAVSLTTATSTNLASVSLTAGDWDVFVTYIYIPGATTSITQLSQGISTTSATLPTTTTGAGDYTVLSTAATVPGSNNISQTVGPFRVSLSGTTTTYAVARPTFTVSTLTVYGSIRARRIR